MSDVIGVGGDGTDFTFGVGGAGLSVAGSSAARIVNLSLSGGGFRAGVSTSFIQGTGLALSGRGSPPPSATPARSARRAPAATA